MIIRNITKNDYTVIFRMLRNYRDSGLVQDMEDCDNELYIGQLLDHIRAGAGLALLAQNDSDNLGVLLAIKTPYIWNPETYTVSELCFWVEPEFRRTTAGHRLITRYVEECKLLRDEGKIRSFNMVRRAGTNIDYSRFGFRPAEENWTQ